MGHVNQAIRKAVRIELARHDMRQSDLAADIEVSRQYLNDIMRGKSGNVPNVWQKIFDKLGLELVVVPKRDHGQEA